MHRRKSVFTPRLGTGITALILAAGVLFGTGCGHENDPVGTAGQGTLQVEATDAPAGAPLAAPSNPIAAILGSAEVTVSEVYLAGNGGEDQVVLHSGTEVPIVLDLLTLEHGVEAMVANVQVPARTYAQLRLVVSDARVTLAPGLEFHDGSTFMDLKVPSGMQSGIKVQLSGPVPVEAEGLMNLVFSFDVGENFVVQGNPDAPQGITGILFTPTLKEVRRTEGA